MRSAAIVLLFLLASCTPTYDPPVSNPDQPDFGRAKKLIEANCADCAGATKEGLVQGIDAMQKALDVGYVDRAAGLRLLATAYNELALLHEKPDSVEKGEALIRRRAVLEQLVAFSPNDPDARYEYVMTLSDPKQRILSLREILAVEPLHEDSRFGLAMTLAEQRGSEPEAVKLLTELVESSDGERALTYAKRLHSLLLQLGRKSEAGALGRRFKL
jgi:hypothetical protein